MDSGEEVQNDTLQAELKRIDDGESDGNLTKVVQMLRKSLRDLSKGEVDKADGRVRQAIARIQHTKAKIKGAL